MKTRKERVQRLEALRLSQNLTKEEFAKKLGVSLSSYYQYLKLGLTEKATERFASALGIRRAWFDEDETTERAYVSAEEDACQYAQKFFSLPRDERTQFIETLRKIFEKQQ